MMLIRDEHDEEGVEIAKSQGEERKLSFLAKLPQTGKVVQI